MKVLGLVPDNIIILLEEGTERGQSLKPLFM
jgi:hypothetical protein